MTNKLNKYIMMKWIDAKNEKPSVNTEVLITDGTDIRVGWINERPDGSFYWYEIGEEEGLDLLDEVTHWMPMPALP